MAGKSVQFKGLENVLRAFEYKNCEVWAVFDGRYLIHKGVGVEELREWLSMLASNGGNPVYTLKVYEDLQAADEVKERTECTGSFGFKLFDDAEIYKASPYSKTDQELNERLKRIEETISGFQDEAEPEPGNEINIGAIINDYLSNPHKLNTLLSGIKQLFSNGTQPAAVGSVGALPDFKNQQTMQTNQPTENDLQRLSNALDVLGNIDAKLPEHLEKLAHLATTKPGMFATLINMLEGM